ncbi:MAG: hypothetical protein ACLQVD_00100 [Capsulimonadaceae bacterium]
MNFGATTALAPVTQSITLTNTGVVDVALTTITADVLNPPASGRAYGVVPDNSTMNNYSVVVRVTCGRTQILFFDDSYA